jgi:hypothetical protein
MEAMGDFLIDFFDDQRHAEYLEELAETAGDHDDYARVAMEMLKRLSVAGLRKLKDFICALINQRDKDLKYRGESEIEKNICKLQEMFKLNKADIELCIFLFAIETYEAPEAFFDSHLNCTKFAGRKYLSNILNLDRSILNSVLNGQLNKSGILETDKYNINLHDEKKSKGFIEKLLSWPSRYGERSQINEFLTRMERFRCILPPNSLDIPHSSPLMGSTRCLLYGGCFIQSLRQPNFNNGLPRDAKTFSFFI